MICSDLWLAIAIVRQVDLIIEDLHLALSHTDLAPSLLRNETFILMICSHPALVSAMGSDLLDLSQGGEGHH